MPSEPARAFDKSSWSSARSLHERQQLIPPGNDSHLYPEEAAKSLQNTPTVLLDIEGGADVTDGHGGQKNAESEFLFPCQHAGSLHDTIPALPSKTTRVGDLHLRGLMVNPVLLCIGLRERQEHVGPGHVGTDVTGIVGGTRFCRIVLGEF